MKRTRLYKLLFWGFLGIPLCAQAQPSLDCENNLDEAKRIYKEGRLSEVGDQIEANCLKVHAFSREKMVEGYRLLTETKLFSNELEEADENFAMLLRYNPLYEVDSTDATASYDLIHLSRTYRRNPLVSLYASGGLGYSKIMTLQQYGADNTVTTVSDVDQVTLGWNASLGLEIPVYKNFDVVIEGNFATRAYLRRDSLYLVGSEQNAKAEPTNQNGVAKFPLGSLQFREVQRWLDVPVMVRYNYEWRKKILPYAYVGAAPNFLLRASLVGITRRNTTEDRGGGEVMGSEKERVIITKNIMQYEDGAEDPYLSTYQSLRRTINVSVVAGVGCKFRIERNFLFFDIRYTGMVYNAVNTANRYTQKELLYRYAHVDNDFRMDNLTLNVGFIKSFYKPRKKRAYNTDLAAVMFDKNVLNPKKAKLEEKEDKGEINQREFRDAMKALESQKRNFIDDVRAGNQKATDAGKPK
jgi:Outer membrane protein beta-barrel domain